MEDFKAPASHGETGTTGPEKNLLELFSFEEYLFAVLIVLSIVGIAITNYSQNYVLEYWLVMVPVFACVSIYYGWVRDKKKRHDISPVIREQILQWAGLLIAVLLVLLLVNYGSISRKDAGYFIIILLSLSTYIAGIRYDWKLIVLSALLGLTAGVAAIVEYLFLIVLIVALLAGAAVFYRRKMSY